MAAPGTSTSNGFPAPSPDKPHRLQSTATRQRTLPMFDHVMLRTQQFDVMTAFYEKALAPLGIKKLMAFESAAGFGRDAPGLWISKSSEPRSSVHLALSSPGPVRRPGVSRCGAGGRRERQWRAGTARLRPELLRRLRHRPRRQQHRSGVSRRLSRDRQPAAQGQASAISVLAPSNAASSTGAKPCGRSGGVEAMVTRP